MITPLFLLYLPFLVQHTSRISVSDKIGLSNFIKSPMWYIRAVSIGAFEKRDFKTKYKRERIIKSKKEVALKNFSFVTNSKATRNVIIEWPHDFEKYHNSVIARVLLTEFGQLVVTEVLQH